MTEKTNESGNESGQETISGRETISQETISGQETIFDEDVRDWALDEQLDLPAEDQREYRLRIQRGYPGRSQFAINIAPSAPECGLSDYPPQLSAALEIDHGVPSLHVGDDRYADFSLSLFFTEKRADHPAAECRAGEIDRFGTDQKIPCRRQPVHPGQPPHGRQQRRLILAAIPA